MVIYDEDRLPPRIKDLSDERKIPSENIFYRNSSDFFIWAPDLESAYLKSLGLISTDEGYYVYGIDSINSLTYTRLEEHKVDAARRKIIGANSLEDTILLES